MNKHGCRDCMWCKCYRGDYWTPDDYECTTDYAIEDEGLADEIFTRVFEDGEEWKDDEDPICPAWVYRPEEPYYYV